MIVTLKDHQEKCNELMRRIVSAAGAGLDVDRQRTIDLARESDKRIERLNSDYLESLREIAEGFEKLTGK